MSDKFKEPLKIGMPKTHNNNLDTILEDKECIFSEKKEIYKLAISIAIKQNKIGAKNPKDMWLSFTVEQIDPAPKYFYNIVKASYPNEEEAVYKTVQRLATAGIEILYDDYLKNNYISLSRYL